MGTIEITSTKPWLTYEAPRWLRVIEHFIRVQIFRQNSYFIDKWTIEKAQEIETMHGLDLEQELADALTSEILKSEPIDRDFMRALINRDDLK